MTGTRAPGTTRTASRCTLASANSRSWKTRCNILTEPNKITKKPNEVKAITLNIGNNDVLGLLNQCTYVVTKEFEETGKSKYGPSPEAAVLGCFAGKISSETIPRVLKNVRDTLTQLEAGYSGPIILSPGMTRCRSWTSDSTKSRMGSTKNSKK